MIEIINKYDCSGCGACFAICPKNAIRMAEDAEGFRYPEVDKELCVSCERCSKICPVLNYEVAHGLEDNHISSVAYRSCSEKRIQSSSGGVFYDLAFQWIMKGGVVVGAAFDSEYHLYHRMIRKVEEIEPLMGSKYLQSDTSEIYREIAEELQNNKVMYFGMTCQVEGVKAYVRNHKNLYCVDLICMGIPSPLVWDKYLDTFFDRKKITGINFKDKHLGWHRFSLSVFNEQNVHREEGSDNPYFQCMFKGYSLRPSCFKCKFKTQNKISDITIADCWGVEKYLPKMDDNKGTSMVISHTEYGEELIKMLSNTGELQNFEYKNVLIYNSHYYLCANLKGNRTLFYKILSKNPRLAFGVFGLNPQKSIIAKVMRKLKI